MTDDGIITKDLEKQRIDQSLVKRRTFLKKGAVAGAGIAALYATPQFSSVFARPAYAGITAVGTTITKSFGELTEATWGGTGIPNDFVAITDIAGLAGGISIRLGLSAHGRFSNPDSDPTPSAVGDVGVHTFGTGSNFGLVTPPSSIEGATWNFNYFMEVDGGTFADCKFCLLYDFDPGVGTAEASLGKLDINAAIAAVPLPLAGFTLIQGSQNLLFGFLGAASSSITPPSFSPFDPTATGAYSFELLAKNNSDVEIGRTSMKVKVV